MVVSISIADATAINDHRVVQQGSLSLANGLHFLQQIAQLLDLEVVDLAELLKFLGIVTVVR